jgi:hypothetical protein
MSRPTVKGHLHLITLSRSAACVMRITAFRLNLRPELFHPNLASTVRVSCHERVLHTSQAAPACAAWSARNHFDWCYFFVRLRGISGLANRLRVFWFDLNDATPLPCPTATCIG